MKRTDSEDGVDMADRLRLSLYLVNHVQACWESLLRQCGYRSGLESTVLSPACMCGRLGDPYPPSPLVRFDIYGSAAARRVATPPPTRTSVNPVRQLCPEQRPIGIELRAALDDLGLEQYPALQRPEAG